MICTVALSLIGHSVINKFCPPAWMKPRLRPITPSPARASREPVSQAERTTSQVPLSFSPPTSSAVTMPSFSIGGTSPRLQALSVHRAWLIVLRYDQQGNLSAHVYNEAITSEDVRH